MEIIPKSENSEQLFQKLVVSMAGFYSKTNRKIRGKMNTACVWHDGSGCHHLPNTPIPAKHSLTSNHWVRCSFLPAHPRTYCPTAVASLPSVQMWLHLPLAPLLMMTPKPTPLDGGVPSPADAAHNAGAPDGHLRFRKIS